MAPVPPDLFPLSYPLRQDSHHTSHRVLLGLPQEHSARLLSKARPVALKEGEALFQRDDAGDGCYWLESGTVKVTVASSTGTERILAILGPGSIVGELAMLDGLPRSATVIALRP